MTSELEITLRHFGRPRHAEALDRAVLRDGRLSWGARGLYHFLWDLPEAWTVIKSHLVSMSPAGRKTLERLLTELRTVGALRFKPRKVDADLAEKLASDGKLSRKKKPYRVGQVIGQIWEVRPACEWALEHPLDPSKWPGRQGNTTCQAVSSTVTPKMCDTAIPADAEGAARVYRSLEGEEVSKPPPSPNNRTVGEVVEGFEELLAAAIWAEARAGRPVRSLGGFEVKFRKRILDDGINQGDLANVEDWKRWRASEVIRERSKREREAVAERSRTKAAAESADLKITMEAMSESELVVLADKVRGLAGEFAACLSIPQAKAWLRSPTAEVPAVLRGAVRRALSLLGKPNGKG